MSLEALIGFDTVTVRQATITKDTSGAPVRTFADLYTDVPARIEDAKASTVYAYALLQQLVTHTVFTQQTGLAVGHMVVDSDGKKYQVQGVKKRRGLGGIDTFYAVDCFEMRPGA